MIEQEMRYDIGAWVVHNHYGVGQIKDIETKPIHGKPTKCFKVRVKDGAFWLPIDSVENPRIRPVASQEIMRKVIKNLRQKPGNLKKDKKYWTQQIKEIPSHGDLLTISQLIRDLSAQKAQKRLTDTQVRALSNFKDRLLLEWSTITGTDIEKLRPQFNEYIQESIDKVEIK